MWWFWNGQMSEANIRRDLAELKSRGIRSVMIWPYVGLVNLEYLSPQWFERVKYAVDEARRLDMRVWLTDEGRYPGGFGGGKVTRERPWQRMQVLAATKNADGQYDVKPVYRTPATRYIHAPGFRKDECGASMQRSKYGKTQVFGWEIDHIKPVAKGGTDDLSNLQPLRWENNRHKGDEWPKWECKLVR